MMPALLFNHLWQSTVFAAVAAGVALALRSNSARVRFWIWLAASLKFLVPFSALASLGALFRSPAMPASAAAPALVAATEPFQRIVFTVPTYAAPAPSRPLWPLVLLGIWLLGSAFLALRWWMRWRRLSRIARAATPSRRLGPIPVFTTAAAIEPGIFGLFRPVLLLPAKLEDRLTPAQLEAVLAHERSHARRRDNLWSALHMAVETLFWFHPFVWWIGAHLVTERELACDEAVLRDGGDPEAYASGIVQVCRYYLESPLACAAGVSGGELKRRLAAILNGGWGRNLSRSRRLMLAGLGALTLLGPIAAGIVFGQVAAATPMAFDAASIRPVGQLGGGRSRNESDIDPERLTEQNKTLQDLLKAAYHLQPSQIVGPSWISSERFDIKAVTTRPVSGDQMMVLLQSFLTRQFQLKLRFATKTEPAYLLEVASGGPRLKAASSAEVLAGSHYSLHTSFSDGDVGADITATGSLDYIAFHLGSQFDRPILNATGLSGVYDFNLRFVPPDRLTSTVPPGSPPSIFTALPQQLGLKLVAGKAPVKVLIVDSGSKTPVGN